MHRLPLPTCSFSNAYLSCINESASENVALLKAITNRIPNHELLYALRAQQIQLHLFQPSRHAHPEDIVFDKVSKREFVDLYSNCFSKQGKKSRLLYDRIKAASDGICPFCKVGIVETLDHYLPKARYPLFSVHPTNLVPSCTDCNKGKGSTVIVSAETEPLHPYFLHECFYKDNWISAEIVESIPITVNFFTSIPDNWDQTSKIRAENHFNDFKIASKYKIQASTSLTMFTSMVESLLKINDFSIEQVQDHFRTVANREPVNTITRAIALAISKSDWFCSAQYQKNREV
ncbi:HNH endonuclease [Pseudoalteromonas sp. SG43-4]|uniref:HNH endonuclease n=1 Tax=Pseudoalteromonas sp. SG43-4 TaxID=2760969 RepID=UPI0015FFDD80|nr:hypothetical protein [Pseudoalteromonas sp. SG43-4]MBB1429474.1 hypothetical protein [Pseudoalteromonas sp. SG43-4]